MIELPALDDRTFADLVAEARAQIPSLSAAWTDHNPTDPGIVLVELLAWLTEMVLYRIDRVPQNSYQTFLRLLRGPESDPSPADPIELDAAIRDTLTGLRNRYRAITTDDFEYLALHRWPELPEARPLGGSGIVRRARCIKEQSPATIVQPGGRAESHCTLVVVPDSLASSRGDLASFASSRRYALELDGATGHVDCGNDASLAIAPSAEHRSSALTLSAWIFPHTLGRRQAIVGKHGSGEYELALETTGALTFRQADGRDGGSSEPRVTVGRWNHVAAVRADDGSGVAFFVDGKPAGCATLTQPAVITSAPVLIGRSPAGDNFFDGMVRDVCIWNMARSESELGGDLSHPPPRNTPGSRAVPVACWRLDSADVGAIAPDAMTPHDAARLRDGKLLPPPGAIATAAARWRDVLRPLSASASLITGLFNLLDEWRLLTTKVHVIGYRPVPLTVSAKLYLRSDGVPAAVQSRARAALDSFLDPLTGGRGDGWPFDRPVYLSDINAVFDNLPGVDFVEQVAIQLTAPEAGRPDAPRGDDGAPIGVALHPHELPELGGSSFELFHRRGTRWQPAI
ncbi:MAG TPA: LamG-like jellyroll fold domain-containing protein [Kofleriaceae bacterium]